MRRITILLLMFGVLAVNSHAEILTRFIDVTWQARNDLNVDTANTTYLPAYEANSRIQAAMSIVNKLVGDNRTNTAIPITVNTYKYALPTDYMAVTSVQWIRADTVKTLLNVPRAAWYEQEHQETKGKTGLLARPSHYDFYDDTIYVHPLPSQTDTLYVTTTHEFPSLESYSTLAGVDEDYRVAILKYVIYETAKARQHPLVALYKQDYERLWTILFPNFGPQNVK